MKKRNLIPAIAMERRYPFCTIGTDGCAHPDNCESCGFNLKEETRRKEIPLQRGRDGYYRIFTGKGGKPENEQNGD